MTTTTTLDTRLGFLEWVFGDDEGFVCIASQFPGRADSFRQMFFSWPEQASAINDHIKSESHRRNVWFCVNLLDRPERKKEFCKRTNLVWADLDNVDPDTIEPPPQCVIQSSPGRWQALWRLSEQISAEDAELLSKRVAYQFGADKSGWDRTQLLRIPWSTNFKYDDHPQVILERKLDILAPIEIFEVVNDTLKDQDPIAEDMPAIADLPDYEAIIYKYHGDLRKTGFFDLYNSDPPDEADWSKLLWRLVNICIENGLSKEETFSVCLHAKCNKYERDNRSPVYLWREVQKAFLKQTSLTVVGLANIKPLTMPKLLDQREALALPETIVEKYCDWATTATDAVPTYHELSVFILLSALASGGLQIPTTYGNMVPNIWALLLGDSTLTRKTTSMQMVMNFLQEIDRELVLATDGSAEGLLTGLAARPNRVSMFFKDEVSGFFESIIKKDYLAGMQETMTQLYDVPSIYTRLLRKETISLTRPIFIFFGGGITDKTYNLIQEQQILSGFLPRFLIVRGEGDLSRIRRTGPPTDIGGAARIQLLSDFTDVYEYYNREHEVKLGGKSVLMKTQFDALLSPEAWIKYGQIEEKMVIAAHESPVSSLALPMFERLSRSLLKMSVLVAASRREPDAYNKLHVEDTEVMIAAKYVQDWGKSTVDLILNSGRTMQQRTLDKVLGSIRRSPGIQRSKVMQLHSLSKREMDEIIGTLLDRHEITIKQNGRGYNIWTI